MHHNSWHHLAISLSVPSYNGPSHVQVYIDGRVVGESKCRCGEASSLSHTVPATVQ